MRLAVFVALALPLLGCGTDGALDPAAGSDETAPDYEPPSSTPTRGPPSARTVYVPAYSQIGDARRATLFAVTLSVRNVDPSATVTLTHVDYFDTSGHRVRRYLSAPRELGPLETAEFSVETFDEAGGSGANFLVYWEGASDAHPLLTESVMIGHIGAGYVAFTSRGVELDRPPAFDAIEAMDDDAAQAPGARGALDALDEGEMGGPSREAALPVPAMPGTGASEEDEIE